MTTTFNVSAARENFAEMISRSAVEEVLIKKHNQVIGVLISPIVWEKMCAAWEDLEDFKAALEIIEDPEEIELMQTVKRELGL
jgi:hypothetical protein